MVHLLVELASQYGKSTKDGLLIDITLSRQELASIIGSTLETVTATLGELQQSGLLTIGRQRIAILDIRRLAFEANFSVPIANK